MPSPLEASLSPQESLIEAARNQLREGLLADGLVEEAGELATASGAAK